MKKLMIISIFAASLLLGVSCGNKTTKTDAVIKTQQVATKDYYTCRMHPEVHKDAPGDCPICGMKLELKKVAKTDSVKIKMSTDSIKK